MTDHDEELAREAFAPPRRRIGQPDSYHPFDPERPDDEDGDSNG